MTDIHEDVLRQLDPLNKITPSEESTRRAISRTRSALLNRCAEDEFTEPQRDRRQWRWNLFLASCIAASLTVIALLAFHGWLRRCLCRRAERDRTKANRARHIRLRQR